MDFIPYTIIAFIGVLSGIMSGISGGGGGMIMIPAFVLVGLPPQTAVATGKMNGLGASMGGLSVFSKSGHIRKDILKVMIPIAILIGITTPFVFSKIQNKDFQIILGCMLIIVGPLSLLKKTIATHGKKHTTLGYTAYSIVLTLQALFGSGVGMLAVYVQKYLFGSTSIQANATKRAISSVLTPITFVALLIGGYVSLGYGLVGFASVFTGTHIGSKIALKRGDKFVSIIMCFVSVSSGVALVFTA